VLQKSSKRYWNVSPKNKAWVADGAYVCGRARVEGNAFLGNNAFLFDNAKLFDNVMVVGRGDGAAYVGGKTIIRNNITIVGAVSLTGNTTLYGDGMIWCKAGNFELSDLHSLLLHGDIRITTYDGCSSDISDGMFFCPEFGKTVVNEHGLMITGGTVNSLIVKIPAK
jgi:UDP-3-O-[3-hydroxymyristoyl] glucosamine N-acyltransferase